MVNWHVLLLLLCSCCCSWHWGCLCQALTTVSTSKVSPPGRLKNEAEDVIIVLPPSDPSSISPTSEINWQLLRISKITMICVIFFLTLLASVLPWWFHRSKRAMTIINLGSCLAAGIIIGLAFSHLFAESAEAFKDYFAIVGPIGLMRPEDVDYPFNALIAGSTLFLLILVDNLVTAHAHLHQPRGHGHAHGVPLEFDNPAAQPEDSKPNVLPAASIEHDHHHQHRACQTDVTGLEWCFGQTLSGCHGGPSFNGNGLGYPSTPCHQGEGCGNITVTDMRKRAFGHDQVNRMCVEPEICPPSMCTNNTNGSEGNSSSSSEYRDEIHPTKIIVVSVESSSNTIENPSIPAQDPSANADLEKTTSEEVNVEPSEPIPAKTAKAFVVDRGGRDQVARAWIFCIALSLHSMFDGLSVGAEVETKAFVAFIVAVISHKFFDGFVVGVALYLGHLPFWHTAAGLVFCAAMTPLGIGIGWAATSAASEGAALKLTKGLIFSISLGTFVFIALIELIPQGMADGQFRALKCVLMLVGFGIMALIAIWV